MQPPTCGPTPGPCMHHSTDVRGVMLELMYPMINAMLCYAPWRFISEHTNCMVLFPHILYLETNCPFDL